MQVLKNGMNFNQMRQYLDNFNYTNISELNINYNNNNIEYIENNE